ncbi:hypothetical protein MTO96_008312 [Rhipicephalus appendiculatus]
MARASYAAILLLWLSGSPAGVTDHRQPTPAFTTDGDVPFRGRQRARQKFPDLTENAANELRHGNAPRATVALPPFSIPYLRQEEVKWPKGDSGGENGGEHGYRAGW